MHYPKVLERVDFPEQIFHRSFSLGAPGKLASQFPLFFTREEQAAVGSLLRVEVT